MPSSALTGAYLAFDLGAESGRAVLAHLRDGVLAVEEIHRFSNEPVRYGVSLHWDVARLWLEMRRALSSLGDRLEGKNLDGIGVDAWGIDYALLGERGELLQNPYHYRDTRTRGVMEQVFRIVGKENIYQTTGIQFMPINTLYQLFAAVRQTPRILEAAESLVTIPDLFNYWLTGHVVCEFTNASTTQMVNPATRGWAADLMDRLGIPSDLPAQIVEPSAVIGPLLPELCHHRSIQGAQVVATASHDTASAVAAVRARDGTAFLSSGTWSLVGVELDTPLITPESMRLNFTNEGGVNGTTRFLKNVMGLWMVQCCRQSWLSRGRVFSYEELMNLAQQEPQFSQLIDPDDESFLLPDDMPAAIDQFCDKTHQPSPRSPGAYVRTILESLAMKYRIVIRNLEYLTGQRIRQIRVIGGGSRNYVLNQFTSDATGTTVLAGLPEAAAVGNVGIQMLATGLASSLKEVREIIEGSFSTEVFQPCATAAWDREVERFQQYCEFTYA